MSLLLVQYKGNITRSEEKFTEPLDKINFNLLKAKTFKKEEDKNPYSEKVA